MTSSLINLEYLNTTCGGSEEMVQTILDMFVSSTPEMMEDLKEQFESKNWDGLKRAAHKAKSSFLTIGARSTSDKLQRIESAALTPDAKGLVPLVDAVLRESDQIIQELIITKKAV